MNRKQIIDMVLTPMAQAFDEKESMIVCDYGKWVGGYHTRRTGITHVIRDTADFAAAVLILEQKQYYDKALAALERICQLQDVRTESPTFGLWPYYLEEDLDHMRAPDYNWSDFIGKNLIGICLLKKKLLTENLFEKICISIRNAMKCSMKRNVGADYTNVSIMGCMTILSAGELLGDDMLLQTGHARLEKLYEYTVFNGAFTEYNSSAYILVSINEIMRMLTFFKEERSLFLAGELNRVAWQGLAGHYNLSIGQLSPPQARAYRNLENGALSWAIWQGTGGRYGSMPEGEREMKDGISLESLCFPPGCPSELFPLFEEKERFLAHTYYRKNHIRTREEDITIVRELDSPDLTAYSWQNEKYSLGAFAFSDCWAQRRNVMAVWGKEHPKYFRLRCINGDYDFCSGVVYAKQDRNCILGHLGLVTDRGSFHYILDQDKNGIYKTDALYFQFELGGDAGELEIRQRERDFLMIDDELEIILSVSKWVFDGKEIQPVLTSDKKAVKLIGYEGQECLLDTNSLKDTYGVFTLTVREKRSVPCGKEEQAVITAGQRKIISAWKGMHVESSRRPGTYRQALGLDGYREKKGEKGMEGMIGEKINIILDRMKHMEGDGTIKESCPISIISMDAWEWPQGVALFAMYQYYRESGETWVLDYLTSWFDTRLLSTLPPQNINTTCPMLTLACIFRETREEKYLPVLMEWLEYAMTMLPKTKEGGLQHVVSGAFNQGQLWDDTLYMTVLFVAKMGEILKEERYLQESIKQFLVHIKYLSDTKTGLFYHGWTFEGCHNFAKALWARGNSWYTAGLVDYLEMLPGNMGVREFLLSALERQVEALAECQHESGLWHTLLNDSESYLETSASCAFAYGILKAVRMGFLPDKYEKSGMNAVAGVLKQIAKDGTVQGVSYGTPVFDTLQEYREIPLCPMPYGQSMALMMLVEAKRHLSGDIERIV